MILYHLIWTDNDNKNYEEKYNKKINLKTYKIIDKCFFMFHKLINADEMLPGSSDKKIKYFIEARY